MTIVFYTKETKETKNFVPLLFVSFVLLCSHWGVLPLSGFRLPR